MFLRLCLVAAAVALATMGSGWAAPERDCTELRTFPEHTMGVHIQGGKQGRNDWYVVDLSRGDVCMRKRGEETRTTLTPAEVSRLRAAVKQSGFFSWRPDYMPKSRVADAVTTEIVVNDGGRRHRVVRADPTPPPAGFLDLARRFELLGYSPYWHSTTYQYVAGRLEHSELEGGFWTVEYAQGDEAGRDKYGGKMVLVIDSKQLRGFKSGDLVLLTGGVDPERAGIQMAGTYYTVKRIEHLR